MRMARILAFILHELTDHEKIKLALTALESVDGAKIDAEEQVRGAIANLDDIPNG